MLRYPRLPDHVREALGLLQLLEGGGFELGPFFGADPERCRRDVLLEVPGPRCSGNRQHDAGALQQPRQRELGRRRVVP